MTWHEHAACIDAPSDWFFPPDRAGPYAYGLARRVCEGCPVRDECLDDSLAHDDRAGMFGGLTPRERARERARRGMTDHTDPDALVGISRRSWPPPGGGDT